MLGVGAMSKGKRKITIELSPTAGKRLDLLKSEVETESPADVFRQSLQLFEWVVKEARKGNKFYIGPTKEDAEEIKVIKLS